LLQKGSKIASKRHEPGNRRKAGFLKDLKNCLKNPSGKDFVSCQRYVEVPCILFKKFTVSLPHGKAQNLQDHLHWLIVPIKDGDDKRGVQLLS